MTDLSTYEYDKAYVEQTEKQIKEYEKQIKLMTIDMKTFYNQLNKAESVVKIIADNYRLPEAKGYFDDTSK